MSKVIVEYNNCETYLHCCRELDGDKVLYGRVGELDETGTGDDWEWGKGTGKVFATNISDGPATEYGNIVCVLGYNGFGNEDVNDRNGEVIIPLSSYEVIQILKAEDF